MITAEAVQRNMTDKSPETLSFHQRLLLVQAEAHGLNLSPEATGQIGSREYKYLTIDKLHSAVLPILFEHGLTWSTFPTTIGEGYPALNYVLSDGEGSAEDTVPLIGCDDMQKLGSAITYARRYCLLAVLGLTPDTDDDASIASKGSTVAPKGSRASVPTIPLDRARKVLEAAQEAGLATDKELRPALKAKLTEVGVETGKIGHLTVDQAEDIEDFIVKEAVHD